KSDPARRRRRDPLVSADHHCLQTTAPSLRQTDDLLSTRDAHAWRVAGNLDHFDAKRSADAARIPGRRLALWYRTRIRRTTKTGRNRASVFDRRKICGSRRGIANFGRQHLLRETRFLPRGAGARARRLHFRLSSARSAALWCRGIRQRRQGDQSRRKTEASAEPIRCAWTLHFPRSSIVRE